jgi:uncharacterized membrane protein YqiK
MNAALLIAAVVLVLALAGFRFIPNKRVGIVEKRWSLHGSIRSGLIALHGEAGFQPALLRGGFHWLMPFQYRVHVVSLVTIPQGKIGYLFARDGRPLEPSQTLASNAAANDFEDAAGFLKNGGQRGPQRQILREGTYAINLAQFLVITKDRIHFLPLQREEDHNFLKMAELLNQRDGFQPVIIKASSDMVGLVDSPDDLLGIVTVHDGPSLLEGQIIAPVVGNDPAQPELYHNNFQDAERFLAAGGRRGRQLQVLVDGTYFLNRLFATVELAQKTVVEVGNAGVVVWYAGEAGADLSGIDYKHGELVEKGRRGVWSEPLLPGKYPFNPYAGKVIPVPTTNFILKWIRTETGAHRFDENLAEVSLITRDAFEPSLPLSVVVHIDYRKAPLVIQRFGDIRRLVEQTLDPMVSAYFKNVGQTRTLIQLLQDRSAIQEAAGQEMKAKFTRYNLELEEVLIGTPTSSPGDQRIEQILAQLRSRQIAEEQVETYGRQEKAAAKEREFREVEARARRQEELTSSEINIAVQTNQGKAEYQRALQEAERVRALAQAESERAARLGVGQAIAIEEQVRAYGGPQFQLAQMVMNRFAEAIQESRVDVVPKVLVSGQSGNGSTGTGSLLEALLAMLLSDRLASPAAGGDAPSPANPEGEALRKEIRAKLILSKK